jgi:uncharacterized membrane protein
MESLLTSPWKAVAAGLVCAALLFVLHLVQGGAVDWAFWAFLLRWIHVLAAIVWIGLVWFVNFVQLPAIYETDDAGRAVILQQIAPNVAWWFRHTATLTLVAGFALAHFNGYLLEALTIGAIDGFAVPKHVVLGIGIWLGIVMWVFVWAVIWPNMKPLIGIVPAEPETKLTARRKVRNFARKNLILSVPVTFAMVAAQNLF